MPIDWPSSPPIGFDASSRWGVHSGEENIEVRPPHLLLGFDPASIHAITDRVACDPESWEPFHVPRFMRSAFPRT